MSERLSQIEIALSSVGAATARPIGFNSDWMWRIAMPNRRRCH
jgi:hypothetical protein